MDDIIALLTHKMYHQMARCRPEWLKTAFARKGNKPGSRLEKEKYVFVVLILLKV